MKTSAARADHPHHAVYPGREEFRRLVQQATLIPVYTEVIADTETPVSALLKLGDAPYRFLLESVERGDRLGRYSFVGNTASLVFRSRGKRIAVGRPSPVGGVMSTFEFEEREVEDPLDALRDLMREHRPAEVPGLPKFYGGAVGYLGYDIVRHIERLPEAKPDPLGVPEAYFVFTDTVLIFDHAQRTLKVVANTRVDGVDPDAAYDGALARIAETLDRLATHPQAATPMMAVRGRGDVLMPDRLRSNFTREEFEAAVERCREYIRAGEILQAIVSQRFSAEVSASPVDIYRSLRAVNPSPYMYYLHFPDLALVGSSPEVMVQLEEGVARVRPIGGTRPRGKTSEEDQALIEELLADEKERAEHVMLVDLGRNDLGRVCEFGSVRVDELMVIEKYSHVSHIVSNVIGRLAPERDAFDLFKATFPAGTVSGAPKVRAMEIIEELEPCRRGPYAGAVGYFGYSGNMDLCITIRTALIKDGVAHVQAGAGIVADSNPAREYEETVNKARAVLQAIAMAEGATRR